MYNGNYVTAVILAAGMGKRMGAGKNKLMLEIEGKNILFHTVSRFFENEFVDEVLVAAAEAEILEVEKIIFEASGGARFKVIKGGADRQESSRIAVCAAKDGIVLIHDGARPFVSDEIIKDVIENTEKYGAAAPGVKINDTVKKAPGGIIEKTVSREELYFIQTPQGFFKDGILKAHRKAAEDEIIVTDDCMLYEHIGLSVKITEGSKDNIKITVKEDMPLAEDILRRMKKS